MEAAAESGAGCPAVLLAFCALSAGMVVHAEEETEEDISAYVPFSSLTVGGKSLDVKAYADPFILNGYESTTAQVSWTLHNGWKVSKSCYIQSGGDTRVGFTNGGTVSIPKKGSTEVQIDADNGVSYAYYRIRIYQGTPKLLGKTLMLSPKGKQQFLDSTEILSQGIDEGADVLSITSSDPEVLEVTEGPTLYACTLIPKKAGTSVVTAVLDSGGEEMTLSAAYTVKKYPKALSSLKVSGKKVDLKKKPLYVTYNGWKKDKAKLEFKTAKGWKFEGGSYWDESAGKYVTFKSGGKIKTAKGSEVIAMLDFVNSKKEYFEYLVVLKR